MVRIDSFCVATDGSNMSYTALRLALALMRNSDTLLLIHGVDSEVVAGKDGIGRMDEATMLRNAQVEAFKFRLRPEQVYAETLHVGDGSSIVQALATAANTRSKMFFVGASGRGHESRSGTKPLGSVAEELLKRVQVPVVLVRSTCGTKFQLRPPDEVHALLPRPPIVFASAVDGSNISKRAFDRAVQLSTPLDTVYAVHAHNGQSNYAQIEPAHQLKNLKPFYEAECLKAMSLKRAKSCTFESIVTKPGETTQSNIADFCDSAQVDLLVMGSIELADPTKKLYLGSVAAACAKTANTNICIIKHLI